MPTRRPLSDGTRAAVGCAPTWLTPTGLETVIIVRLPSRRSLVRPPDGTLPRREGGTGMDLELRGKVAIVGGASKGLGRACAQVLAEEGAKVAVCSRSKPDLEKAAQEIRDSTRADVFAFAGDLDRPETI